MDETTPMLKSLKESPELTFAALAFLAYTVSLVCGLFPFGDSRQFGPVEYYWISSTLWVFGGLMALYFLYVAFFDMWIYGLRLIVIYGFCGLGTMFAAINYSHVGYRFLGVLIIAAGAWQAFELMKLIWRIRLEKIRAAGKEMEDEAYEKYSLGSWPFMPFLFFGAATFSFYQYALWYVEKPWFDDEQTSLGLYAMAELFVMFIAVYTLMVPQKALFDEERVESRRAAVREEQRGSRFPMEDEGEDEEAEAAGMMQYFQLKTPTLLKSRAIKNPVTLLAKTPAECPICRNRPTVEKRACPSCGHEDEFAFCPYCESYLKYCEECAQPTFVGSACMNCGKDIKRSVKCSNCGTTNAISRMRRVG